MGKLAKREKGGMLKGENILAVIWGFVILNIGGILLFVLFNFSSLLYVPYYNIDLQDVTAAGTLQPELLRIMNSGSLYGVSLVVLLILQSILYGFTGWFVQEKAKSKNWYIGIFPLILLLLGSLISFLIGDVSYPNLVLVPMGYIIWLVSMLTYQMGFFSSITMALVVFGIVGCGLLVLFNILGGVAAKHLRVK